MGKIPDLPKMPFGQRPPVVDDCDRPACDDVVDAMSAAIGRVQQKQKQNVECPPSSPELGRASWTLLHSMVAWYPDTPTKEEKSMMVGFMTTLARFYPCTWCASDFQEKVKEKPVRAESRTELCQWLCQQHNLVNKKLGKKQFPCDMKTLDERWRKSSNPKCKE
mmetsp:Transcript_25727/g.38006  ORF Transcript_25727/g.38006 Transcript_25727/m.38006 type:complete len:164 (-) Transcript_25727:37-528(-)